MKIKFYLDTGDSIIVRPSLEQTFIEQGIGYCKLVQAYIKDYRALRAGDKILFYTSDLTSYITQGIIQRIVKLYDPSKRFYFTVDRKFEFQIHPLGVHPDGYILVIADTETDALIKINKLHMGDSVLAPQRHYDFMLHKHLYPLGEVARLIV